MKQRLRVNMFTNDDDSDPFCDGVAISGAGAGVEAGSGGGSSWCCVVDERAGRGGASAGGGRGPGRRGGSARRASLALARYPQTAQVPVHGIGRVRAARRRPLAAHHATVLQFW